MMSNEKVVGGKGGAEALPLGSSDTLSSGVMMVLILLTGIQ